MTKLKLQRRASAERFRADCQWGYVGPGCSSRHAKLNRAEMNDGLVQQQGLQLYLPDKKSTPHPPSFTERTALRSQHHKTPNSSHTPDRKRTAWCCSLFIASPFGCVEKYNDRPEGIQGLLHSDASRVPSKGCKVQRPQGATQRLDAFSSTTPVACMQCETDLGYECRKDSSRQGIPSALWVGVQKDVGR